MNKESIQDRIILKIFEKQLSKINNAIIDVRYKSLGNSVGPVNIEAEDPYTPSNPCDDVHVVLHIELNTDNQLVKDSFSELEEYDLKNGWNSMLSKIDELEYDLECPSIDKNMEWAGLINAAYEEKWRKWLKTEEAESLRNELYDLQKKRDFLVSEYESNNKVLKQIIEIALNEIRQVMAEKFAKEEAKRPKVVPEGFDRPLSEIPARADDPRVRVTPLIRKVYAPEDVEKMKNMSKKEAMEYKQNLILQGKYTKVFVEDHEANKAGIRPKVVPEGFDRPLSDIPAREGDVRFKSGGFHKRIFAPEDVEKIKNMNEQERLDFMRELVEQGKYTLEDNSSRDDVVKTAAFLDKIGNGCVLVAIASVFIGAIVWIVYSLVEIFSSI